ncbi:hypothetical protein BsWGS_00515 [Bradybaena similaris]
MAGDSKMSITVEGSNADEKPKLLIPLSDELGISKPGKMVSPVVSAAEKDNIAEIFDPSSCPECKLIMEKKKELMKQRRELKQSVARHEQLDHPLLPSEGEREKSLTRDPPSDILEVFKNTKYTGNLSPLSSRLPDSKAIQKGAQPPMPGVKRLKGDLAKSVGNKIDGCDWFVFHPYVDLGLPEELNQDGGLKQA